MSLGLVLPMVHHRKTRGPLLLEAYDEDVIEEDTTVGWVTSVVGASHLVNKSLTCTASLLCCTCQSSGVGTGGGGGVPA